MIYLDNSATTYKKPFSVKYQTKKYIQSANPGRSGHNLSVKSATMITNTRLLLQDMYNAPATENVIFTSNCTEALNIAILGTVKKGGHIIVSTFEHNSVLRPIHHLATEGLITYTIIEPNNKHTITYQDVKNAIQDNTYMVIVNHITNTTGDENDVYNIGKLCKENNFIFLCDCAQSGGHKLVDMQKYNINLLTIAGHKGFFAPQNIGALIINNIKIKPIKYGGTGTSSININQPDELPEMLESGTLSTPLIAGLNAGIKYLNIYLNKNSKKIAKLTQYLLNRLNEIKNITIYTDKLSTNGVVLFNLKEYDSTQVADYLNKHKIYVRGGLHCAPLAHKFLNTTKKGGVRISLNNFNNKRHIDKLIKVLKILNDVNIN